MNCYKICNEISVQNSKDLFTFPDFGKYNALVAGIVAQAVKDLRKAKKKGNFTKAAEIRKWFISDWAQSLTGGNGMAIVERIEREDRKKRQNETLP